MNVAVTMPDYKRRAMTRAEVVEILLTQGADLFALVQILPPKRGLREKDIWNLLEQHEILIPCGNFSGCGSMIARRADCRRDHKISLRKAPDGQHAQYDRAWNQWYLCHPCDQTKTSKRGLTGLGSDASRIAKLRRVERKESEPCQRKGSSLKSAGFPKPKQKMKILSRPFPKKDKKRAK